MRHGGDGFKGRKQGAGGADGRVKREKMAVGVMRRTVIGQGDIQEEESSKLEGRKRGQDETMAVLEKFSRIRKPGQEIKISSVGLPCAAVKERFEVKGENK